MFPVFFGYHYIGLCDSLVQGLVKCGQVLLYLLDQRTVSFHECLQSRGSSLLLHVQVGQSDPEVFIQDRMHLLIPLYNALPYLHGPSLNQEQDDNSKSYHDSKVQNRVVHCM